MPAQLASRCAPCACDRNAPGTRMRHPTAAAPALRGTACAERTGRTPGKMGIAPARRSSRALRPSAAEDGSQRCLVNFVGSRSPLGPNPGSAHGPPDTVRAHQCAAPIQPPISSSQLLPLRCRDELLGREPAAELSVEVASSRAPCRRGSGAGERTCAVCAHSLSVHGRVPPRCLESEWPRRHLLTGMLCTRAHGMRGV